MIEIFSDMALKLSVDYLSILVTFAKLLKLPKVTKPLDNAGVGHTGPASGEGV